jgi:MYXO-CTERM domain-containing protein
LYVSTNGGAKWSLTPGTLYNNPPTGGGVNLNTDSSIDTDPGGRLYFTFDWPYAGTTAVCVSDNKAQSFSCNPATIPGGTDRMWLVSPSNTGSYLVTNIGLYQTIFAKSGDRGGTWAVTQTTTAALNPDTGPLIKSPLSHLIYQPYASNATNLTATNNLNSGPLGFHVFDPSSSTPLSNELLTPLPAPNALPSAGFTNDGTLYLASEQPRYDAQQNLLGYQLVVARSGNQGATWTVLPPLPNTGNGTQTFSAIATAAPGHVGLLFYKSATGGDPTVATGATWDAVWAESIDADTASPHWSMQTVDANVHTGPICSTAGCSGDNRYSGDFISATFDANDTPYLTWVKDLDQTGNNTRVMFATAAGASAAAPEMPAPAAAALVIVGIGAFVLHRRRYINKRS